MRSIALVVLSLLFLTHSAQTNELQYTTYTELREEVAKRARDIERTEERIAMLLTEAETARNALAAAKMDNRRIETAAAFRARLCYRFSKTGDAVRFLFNADSVVEMLKRIQFLKKLLTDGLEARREAGLRIAATEKRLFAIEEDKEAARSMHQMLQQTYLELSEEMRRRKRRPQ